MSLRGGTEWTDFECNSVLRSTAASSPVEAGMFKQSWVRAVTSRKGVTGVETDLDVEPIDLIHHSPELRRS